MVPPAAAAPSFCPPTADPLPATGIQEGRCGVGAASSPAQEAVLLPAEGAWGTDDGPTGPGEGAGEGTEFGGEDGPSSSTLPPQRPTDRYRKATRRMQRVVGRSSDPDGHLMVVCCDFGGKKRAKKGCFSSKRWR